MSGSGQRPRLLVRKQLAQWSSPVEEAGEIPVEPLVAADELVRESEPRHEAPLLEPEDGAEAAEETRRVSSKAKSVSPPDSGGRLLRTCLPLKKMPSTQANASRRSAKLRLLQARRRSRQQPFQNGRHSPAKPLRTC